MKRVNRKTVNAANILSELIKNQRIEGKIFLSQIQK
jgi:hypothetical protein